MTNKINEQCSSCRGVGAKLFLKGEKCNGPKCGIVRRNFPSGQHGVKKKRAKHSGYGRQLIEKQKAKKVYGILERQFTKYAKEAVSKTGDTSKFLLGYLESRLDNVVYRMGLGASRRASRQIVSHGHIIVNDRKVDVPSFRVRVGDVVSVGEISKKKIVFDKIEEKIAKKNDIPGWMAVDAKKLSAKVLNTPIVDNCSFDVKSIIEFYSKKI